MTVEIDTKTFSVKRLAPMKYAREQHGACRAGDFIYVCGGRCKETFILDCERYRISTNEWLHDVPRMQDMLLGHSMIALNERYIYSFGGKSINH